MSYFCHVHTANSLPNKKQSVRQLTDAFARAFPYDNYKKNILDGMNCIHHRTWNTYPPMGSKTVCSPLDNPVWQPATRPMVMFGFCCCCCC